jgi:hypothetical protein
VIAVPQPSEPTPMTQFRDGRSSIMDQLHKAGLLEIEELNEFRSKQESGAGKLPVQRSGMAPMISSVPQADR